MVIDSPAGSLAEAPVREASRSDLSHLLATASTVIATILAVALGMLANAHFQQEREIRELEAEVQAGAIRITRLEAQHGEVLRILERIEKKVDGPGR